MGCLLRVVACAILLLALAIGARRLLESPARTEPPRGLERETIVDGVRWRSREAAADPGSAARPPVVYVHGFLSSSATWKGVLASAAAGREAVAVDLPGAGFSDRPWPFDYTVFGQAQHLIRYLDARGWPRVVLVGNSLGGAVCEVVAAARPERISGLVLVDAASPRMRIPIGFRLLRTPVLGDLQIELLTRPVMAFALKRRLYANPARVTEQTVDDWWDPVPVPGTRRAAIASVRTSLSGTDRLLESIRVPTFVLWGKDDPLLDVSEGLSIASAIPGARFAAIPGAGHLPQEESPGAFSREVSAFVRGLPEGGDP
ncbi:MAG: alpha/beta hydrolase [Acidobacteriota bacterium]